MNLNSDILMFGNNWIFLFFILILLSCSKDFSNYDKSNLEKCNDIVNEINFLKQSPSVVQATAEKSVAALVNFATSANPLVNLNRIRKLLE